MIARLLLGGAMFALAACAEEPRSAKYFERHPKEAAEISAHCVIGVKGGEECVNAEAGLAAVQREERMDAYRRQL